MNHKKIEIAIMYHKKIEIAIIYRNIYIFCDKNKK